MRSGSPVGSWKYDFSGLNSLIGPSSVGVSDGAFNTIITRNGLASLPQGRQAVLAVLFVPMFEIVVKDFFKNPDSPPFWLPNRFFCHHVGVVAAAVLGQQET
jgi:hypothetical protein